MEAERIKKLQYDGKAEIHRKKTEIKAKIEERLKTVIEAEEVAALTKKVKKKKREEESDDEFPSPRMEGYVALSPLTDSKKNILEFNTKMEK